MLDTQFGDHQSNSNGEEFKHFVNRRSMTVYDTDKQTHLTGGRLDYVIGKDLVHGNVCTSLVRELQAQAQAHTLKLTLVTTQ